ncbi:hypothetical protein UFOVP236_19 [uncultured Caudovirales phage]|uniref:Intramolecular chaperone auto-processing domain containing protein n=1 Tax=uncultured Caudovirales phage TaxID=2100421 RepID=A0A6J7WTZ5_9CAUD|nr:hypothetical protein UFOVP236_19 [uncultured Caudovirales phage]
MSFIRDLLFGSPPDPNPGMQATAAANEKVGLEQIALGREQLQYQKERAAQTDAITSRLVNSNADLMDTQRRVADSEYKRYQDTYVPIENQIADEAKNFDTEATRERYASTASADVAQAFRGAAGQTLRAQSRMGLRPSADAFAAVNSKLSANEAGAKAAAMTGARYNARDTGLQLKMNAVNIGKGLPGTAANAASGSVNASNSAGGLTFGANQSYNSGAASANSFTNTGLNFMNSAAQGYSNISNYGLQSYGMTSQQMAAMINGAGAAFGGRADGREVEGPGHVSGPGTGISDSIPARLSDGEYVIPADVVKHKGVEFFDKLLDKYHMPAAEQKRKYGIGGR